MGGDIKDLIDFITKEDLPMYNKAELARRYDCNPRTIDRYLKIQSGELKPKENTREYLSKLDDYKDLIESFSDGTIALILQEDVPLCHPQTLLPTVFDKLEVVCNTLISESASAPNISSEIHPLLYFLHKAICVFSL